MLIAEATFVQSRNYIIYLNGIGQAIFISDLSPVRLQTTCRGSKANHLESVFRTGVSEKRRCGNLGCGTWSCNAQTVLGIEAGGHFVGLGKISRGTPGNVFSRFLIKTGLASSGPSGSLGSSGTLDRSSTFHLPSSRCNRAGPPSATGFPCLSSGVVSTQAQPR